MPSSSVPTANKYSRGWFDIVFGESGVADALKWIRRKADNSFDVVEVAASVHTHAQSDTTNLVSALAAKAPLASPAFTGFIDLAEIAAPATPAAGKVRVYAKADKKLYALDSDGLETALF